MDVGAVFAPPDGLEVIDGAARPNLTQNVILVGEAFPGDDQRDRLPDGFRLREAEHPLGGAIPRGDDALEILADNRIVGKLDDRGQVERGSISGAIRHGAIQIVALDNG